jgi:hypothetical protein
MRTIKLGNGKYEFDLSDGRLVAARRHGEEWPTGLDLRFTGCFMAALTRIAELESPRCDVCGREGSDLRTPVEVCRDCFDIAGAPLHPG